MAWITTKDGRQVNTEWFDDDERKKYEQIEESQRRADELNGKALYEPQKFKLVHSAYGRTVYESELFEIHKYSRNSSNTSWKESGYTLRFKKRPMTEKRFSSLKEAKAWLDTDEAKEWYKKNKR